MATVIWSERAISDLEGIYDYIARDSILYAQYTIQNIFKSTERLQLFPNSGRFLPELPNTLYRELIMGNYRIIYRYDEAKDKVMIVTVLHGSRLLKEDIFDTSVA